MMSSGGLFNLKHEAEEIFPCSFVFFDSLYLVSYFPN